MCVSNVHVFDRERILVMHGPQSAGCPIREGVPAEQEDGHVVEPVEEDHGLALQHLRTRSNEYIQATGFDKEM
jgi:hypothetical protein